MPLPPALLAKLQKRGIVSKDGEQRDKVDECEEVIAEDYDEPNSKSAVFNRKLKAPAIGCPNKYNIYHECGDYCHRRWGLGKENPSPTIQRKYQKLLKRYPLSDEWQQVWDPGCACYYFWNTVNDEVAWLPPLHPKTVKSMSANKLRAMLKEDENISEESCEEDASSDDEGNDSELSENSSSDSQSDNDSDEVKKNKSSFLQKRTEYFEERNRSSGGRERLKRNDLDPMDPASYSESCPRGKWSDGLESQGEAKSGVDSTAGGTLYQARPYPSPGSVLRTNKKLKSDDS